MMLFVFFVAVINLAVGYALAGGVKWSLILERLPALGKKTPAADLDIEDDEPLTRPAPKAKAEEPKPQPQDEPTEPVAEEADPAKAKPTAAEIMAGLASFRDNLSEVSAEVKESAEDPESFEQNAAKLQEANHAYLEEAEGSIKQLDELDAAGDKEASASRDAVAKESGQIAKVSGELDEMIETGIDTQEARSKFVAKTSEIAVASETTGEAAPANETDQETSADEPDAPLLNLSNSLASIDELFNRLESVLAASEPEMIQHVAAIRVDPIADHEGDKTLIESLEDRVARIASEVIEQSQAFVQGQPAMLLLEGDSFEDASERLERLRQQVEATSFQRGGESIRATITCAVADARTGLNRKEIVEQLNQALEESSRLGTNRTFHHDGAFPTPVPELPVEASARTIKLS